MHHHEIFEALVRNAFDFLQRAIAEFDEAPKYSVIHFCAAVEMLLKARLMREHWTLIVAKPEQAQLDKFMAGDFTSIALDDARSRLRDIVGESVSDAAFDSFRALARHRNKMVHFFHPELDSDEATREQIVAEQCRSWFHLHRLLEQWDEHFGEFQGEISTANNAMKQHRKYLQAKFKALKPELDEVRKNKRKPELCKVCGFKAAVTQTVSLDILAIECLVCDQTATWVAMVCPHCNKSIVIRDEGFATCEHCDGAIEPEHVVGALVDDAAAHRAITDGGENLWEVNCGHCDGYHTAFQYHDDKFFCASCFNWSEHAEKCEWCNEYSTGRLRFSYASGCGQCEGQWGHIKDD